MGDYSFDLRPVFAVFAVLGVVGGGLAVGVPALLHAHKEAHKISPPDCKTETSKTVVLDGRKYTVTCAP